MQHWLYARNFQIGVKQVHWYVLGFRFGSHILFGSSQVCVLQQGQCANINCVEVNHVSYLKSYLQSIRNSEQM